MGFRDGVHNAIIESASLGAERGFVLDSWIHVDYGGSGQGFGGFALYLGESSAHHSVSSPAGHWIWRVMQVAGVESWTALKGRSIRCRVESGRIVAIGHIIKDIWFEPEREFAEARAAEASA